MGEGGPAPSLREKSGTHPSSPVWKSPPISQQNTAFSAPNNPFFVVKHWHCNPKWTTLFSIHTNSSSRISIFKRKTKQTQKQEQIFVKILFISKNEHCTGIYVKYRPESSLLLSYSLLFNLVMYYKYQDNGNFENNGFFFLNVVKLWTSKLPFFSKSMEVSTKIPPLFLEKCKFADFLQKYPFIPQY